MKTSVFILAIAFGFALAASMYFGTWASDYESRTAQNKQKYLWNMVLADKGKTGSWPGALELGALVAPSPLGTSFTPTGKKYSDQFEQGRSKGIHSVGLMAKAHVSWNNAAKTKYTGGFTKADYAILRFSTATKPATPLNDAPGAGIKILRDGIASGSTPVMYDLEGQFSGNFFEHCLSNHINAPPADRITMAQKILLGKFKRYDSRPGLVGLSDISRWNQDGSEVKNPKGPLAMVWVPKPEMTKKCQGIKMNDDGTYGCLEGLKAGDVIYDIYGVDEAWVPKSLEKLKKKTDALTKLGELVLDSEFRKSKSGDENIAFKHVYWADEVKATGMENTWGVGDDYETFGGCKKYFG